MSSDGRDVNLARAMKALADMEASAETPTRVEAAVMARWDADHAPRTRSRTSRVVRGAASAAAGITIVGALAWPRGTIEPAGEPAGEGYTTVAVVGGPLMPGEPIRVVRMRVARAVLGELGISSASRADSAEANSVDIDVLVGEDGVARGVRVPISEL